ncbi:MAG: universal stress protein, partial [Myxococcota bacterium]
MNRLNTILFATDLSEASAHALEHAALIAAKNDAALHVVNVRVPFSESVFARAAVLVVGREVRMP